MFDIGNGLEQKELAISISNRNVGMSYLWDDNKTNLWLFIYIRVCAGMFLFLCGVILSQLKLH